MLCFTHYNVKNTNPDWSCFLINCPSPSHSFPPLIPHSRNQHVHASITHTKDLFVHSAASQLTVQLILSTSPSTTLAIQKINSPPLNLYCYSSVSVAPHSTNHHLVVPFYQGICLKSLFHSDPRCFYKMILQCTECASPSIYHIFSLFTNYSCIFRPSLFLPVIKSSRTPYIPSVCVNETHLFIKYIDNYTLNPSYIGMKYVSRQYLHARIHISIQYI